MYRLPDEIDYAIRQLISGVVSSNEVIDIFSAVGLLQKLMKEEIQKMSGKRNLVKTRTFLEMLEASLKKYQNRAI